ncbi:MAG: NBR1-Ig-like domain-containing protein [Anaerolineales bacterium]
MSRITLRPRLFIFLFAFAFLQACAPQATPTVFRPPTQPGPTSVLPTTTPVPDLFTPVPTLTITATAEPGPCTNNLDFVDDLTIKDGTSVSAGSSIDKQWLVQNSGSCNWDESYRLRWIGGDPLGANTEQLLYPARSGAQATLRIIFTAPSTDGPYESAWQAVDPDGNVFGDLIYIKIVVSP